MNKQKKNHCKATVDPHYQMAYRLVQELKSEYLKAPLVESWVLRSRFRSSSAQRSAAKTTFLIVLLPQIHISLERNVVTGLRDMDQYSLRPSRRVCVSRVTVC